MTQPIHALEGKITALIERYRKLQQEKDALASERDEQNDTIAEQRRSLENAQAHIKELRGTITEQEEQLAGRQQAIVSLNEQLAALQEANDDLKHRLGELEQNSQDAAGRIDEILSQIDEL